MLRYKFQIGLIEQLIVSSASYLVVFLCALRLGVIDIASVGILLSIYSGILVLNMGWLFMPMTTAVGRQTLDSDDLLRLACWQLASSFITAIAGSMLFFCLNTLDPPTSWWTVIALPAGFLLAQQWLEFLRRTLHALGMTRLVLVSSAACHVLRVTGCGTIAADTTDVTLVLTGTALIGCGVSIGGLLAYACRTELARTEGAAFVHWVRSVKLVLPSMGLAWLWTEGPLLLLATVRPAESVALFVTARQLANLFNPITEYIEVGLSAALTRDIGRAKSTFYYRLQKILRPATGVWAIGLVIIIFSGEKVLCFITQASCADTTELLIVFWAIQGIVLGIKLAEIWTRAVGNEHAMLWGRASAAAASVCIGVWAVHHGELATAITILVAGLSGLTLLLAINIHRSNSVR